MSDKRVLVTGGAGFVGSHLCERLVALGHDVLRVDNYFTGPKSNLAHRIGKPNFAAMRPDITFPLYVAIAEIYNLACPASPKQYQFDPVQTTKTSVLGGINMLGLAKRTKAKNAPGLYLRDLRRSRGAFSERKLQRQCQPDSLTGPRACYDKSKRCAETLFNDYRRQHGVRVNVARIFNTYGSRMADDDGCVVGNLITQALADAPIPIYGEGQQTRSFCYISDLVDALIALMDTPDDVAGPVNLGSPEEVTVTGLGERIIQGTGSRSALVRLPAVENDPRRRCPEYRACPADLGLGAKGAARPRTEQNHPLL